MAAINNNEQASATHTHPNRVIASSIATTESRQYRANRSEAIKYKLTNAVIDTTANFAIAFTISTKALRENIRLIPLMGSMFESLGCMALPEKFRPLIKIPPIVAENKRMARI